MLLIENRVFRMHSQLVPAVMLVAALLVAIVTIFGTVIVCDDQDCERDQEECEDLCWGNSHPVSGGVPLLTRWFYVVFVMQALLHTIPWLLWHTLENRETRTILGLLKHKRLNAAVEIFVAGCSRKRYGRVYIGCEILNWAISLGQVLWLVDTESFPTITTCYLQTSGPGGNPVTDSFLCLLPLNHTINRIILGGIRYLMGIVFIVSTLNLMFRAATLFFANFRSKYFKSRYIVRNLDIDFGDNLLLFLVEQNFVKSLDERLVFQQFIYRLNTICNGNKIKIV